MICSLFGCVLFLYLTVIRQTCIHTLRDLNLLFIQSICQRKHIPHTFQRELYVLNLATVTWKMWRWKHVWRHLFTQAWVCFRTSQTIVQTVFENHHGAFQASDDIWALENSVVPFFISAHRQSSVPSAYLIPNKEQQSIRGESGWEFNSPE